MGSPKAAKAPKPPPMDAAAAAAATEGLLGVTWDALRNKFKARIHYERKERFLGRCVSLWMGVPCRAVS
jgi:hypothetical protein